MCIETQQNQLYEEINLKQERIGQLLEKIEELHEKFEADKKKVEIGHTMLELPTKCGRWPGRKSARRLHALAYLQIPAASAKYMQVFIPLVLGAFFMTMESPSILRVWSFCQILLHTIKRLTNVFCYYK